MTTILEKIFTFIAPNECIFCSNEGNIICSSCVFDLSDEHMCCCHVCGLPVLDYQPCQACRKHTQLDGLFILGPHEEEIRQLVALLKFQGKRQVADDIAPALIKLLPYFEEAPLVTHLPTAYLRARERGFDQAHLLAKALADQQQWQYIDVFRRIGNARQVGADQQTRQRQAATMFALRRSPLNINRPLFLVDDVVTTGASMEAAARLLKEAGAPLVYGVALARTR